MWFGPGVHVVAHVPVAGPTINYIWKSSKQKFRKSILTDWDVAFIFFSLVHVGLQNIYAVSTLCPKIKLFVKQQKCANFELSDNCLQKQSFPTNK